jgi:hypothetical protein
MVSCPRRPHAQLVIGVAKRATITTEMNVFIGSMV